MLQQQTKIFTIYLYLGHLGATLSAFLLAYWIRGSFLQDFVRILFPFYQYMKLLWAVLEAIPLINRHIEFYPASSSEMVGKVRESSQIIPLPA